MTDYSFYRFPFKKHLFSKGENGVFLLRKQCFLIGEITGNNVYYPNVMFSTSMDSWRKSWACSLNLSGFSVVR